MTYPTIEMYDISCTSTRAPWSPFTARTYLALRLLGIPFTRHLVPMASIRELRTSAGVPPTKDGGHLLPAITVTTDGSTRWVTDSEDIAALLQELYVAEHPLDQSLYPDQDAKDARQEVQRALRASLYTDERWKSLVPAVLEILEPESQQFFIETRTRDWGSHPHEVLEAAKQVELTKGGAEQVIADALEPFANVYQAKNKPGTWIGGDRPVYADLVVIAALQWYSCARPEFQQAIKLTRDALQNAWSQAQPLLHEA